MFCWPAGATHTLVLVFANMVCNCRYTCSTCPDPVTQASVVSRDLGMLTDAGLPDELLVCTIKGFEYVPFRTHPSSLAAALLVCLQLMASAHVILQCAGLCALSGNGRYWDVLLATSHTFADESVAWLLWWGRCGFSVV